MWVFKAKQRRFKIGKIEVGGVPGERPVTLIGSLFFRGHRIVKDEVKGEFDKAKAEKLVNIQDEFSEKTGNPCMIDVVGSTPEAMVRFLDFVADVSDAPMLLDGVSASVRVESLKYVKEVGLSSRIVYNTIVPEYKPEEIEAIRESGVEAVVFLAYYMRDFTARGRVKISREIIPKLLEAGIEKILIDTCVLDIPTLGSACKAIFELKNELGYPVGCGAHNAIGTWRGLKTKMGRQAKRPSVAAASVLPASVGADFILYGPIEAARYVFPAVAMVDAAYAQLLMEAGRRPPPGHPIFRIA